ncbi:hypothetical protein BV20DRAFT_982276 [Pilatotrama ljubarskyi]|nr:hypothetical protein BV20DRAFT_982276 [Pilatotrama ljubarskyi]
MDTLALPYDVIYMILEMSSPRTIAAMMGTCRTLYKETEGARLLLRPGVALALDKDIISFSQFMLSDAPNRFPYLRKMTLSRGEFSAEAVDALQVLITHDAIVLESLVLRDAEYVLSSGSSRQATVDDGSSPSVDLHPPLLGAFASLTTLRHLTMEDLDERAYALLHMLPPGLVSATLALDSPRARWGAFGGNPDDRNPIVHLAAQADTLEELTGSGFDAHPDHVRYDVVYPRVRYVRAGWTHVSRAMPATVAYVHAFPNVEHLVLRGTRSEDEEYDSEDAEEEYIYEDERAARTRTRRSGYVPEPDPFAMQGLRVLRASNKSDQTNYGSWQRLRLVEGTVVDVYALGLVCHVPELRLEGDVTRPLVQMLQSVIDDVLPEKLALTVVGGAMFAEGPGGAVRALFAAPMAQCLRELDLEVCFAPWEGDADMALVLENIFQTLTVLPLHSLTLTLNHGLLSRRHAAPRGRARGRSLFFHCPAERFLNAFDVAEYARRFRHAVPSLSLGNVVEVRRVSDGGPHRYLLGPYGGGRGSPADLSEGEDEQDEWGTSELAELGFGTALNLNDDSDEGW